MEQTKSNLIDVSFGIPGYMHEYWRAMAHVDQRYTDIKIDSCLSYTFGRTNPRLESAIIGLHQAIGNAETKGYKIVVGHGASQLVSAIAYAAGKIRISEILLEPPYWGRLKFLLEMGIAASGVSCWNGGHVKPHKALVSDRWFKFATSPNNPNGSVNEPEGDLKVVDMCYYWPQYVEKIEKKAYDVMIFGLSKATGHAGTRIGWALVKDPVVEKYMREYIELSTCGTSNDAQKRAHTVLWLAQSKGNMSCFEFGKKQLSDRWAAFNAVAAKNKDFKVLNTSGMFAWCEMTTDSDAAAEEQMENLYKLKVMPGLYFGVSSDKQFRINLGCADQEFSNMIGVLRGSAAALAGD